MKWFKKKNALPESVETGEKEININKPVLTGTDEETAAIIMAIVADETKKPLENLRFRSIKSINGGVNI